MAPKAQKNLMLQDLSPMAVRTSEAEEPVNKIVYSHFNPMKVAPRGRPRTRPRPTDPGVLEAICEMIIMGHGISSFLDDDECRFPTRREYYRELAANPNGDFSQGILRARMQAHFAISDRCTQIAEESTADTANADKVKISWYQWHLGKLLPAIYSEKLRLDQRVNINNDAPLKRDDFEDIAYKVVDEF